MIYKTVFLKDEFPSLESNANLTSYCISNHNDYPYDAKRKAMLVIPGGGYEFVAEREGEPIALKLISSNINAFVLRYTVGNFRFPYPLIEVFAALAFIKKHADEFNVDANHVGVIGFSAGGHLAASACIHQNDANISDLLNISNFHMKISAVVLSYPVILVEEKLSHVDSIRRITQNNEKLKDYFDICKHVDSTFPPCFIWTTKTDQTVPCINSIMLKNKLDDVHVMNEFHLYESGAHGGSSCDDLTCSDEWLVELKCASSWVELMIKFLKENL